jgi:hypothetical protein
MTMQWRRAVRGGFAILCVAAVALVGMACSRTATADTALGAAGGDISVAEQTDTRSVATVLEQIERYKEATSHYIDASCLAVDELFCFAFEDGYLTVSGIGNPITSFSELTRCYSGIHVPELLWGVPFSSASVQNGERVTWQYSETLSDTLLLQQITRVPLEWAYVREIYLNYQSEAGQRTLTAVADDEAHQAVRAPQGTHVPLTDGYFSLQDGTRHYLGWSENGWTYYLEMVDEETEDQLIEMDARHIIALAPYGESAV